MHTSSPSLEGISASVADFQIIRAQTELICQPLEVEDYVVQPIVDVSPPKWHLAHTTWFFERFLLQPYLKGYQLFSSEFPLLFNSYYVAAGDRWLRAERGNLTRPTVKEIYAYRAYVDRHMVELLEDPKCLDIDGFKYVFTIGLNHEQQHQELLLYDIKYILGHNPLLPKYHSGIRTKRATVDRSEPRWLAVDAGNYRIGASDDGFCFDNEQGQHQVYLESFDINQNLVTNAEYGQFIAEGGYHRSDLWLSEGWDWASLLDYQCPMYWHKINEQWHQYTFTGLQPLDMDSPVMHVSFYEADAFARWSGARLPLESEWEVAARLYQPDVPENGGFIEDQYLAVDHQSHDFMGHLWEWTSSPYRPYPRYKAPDGALGEYNGKFMINQMVLRGGSFATSRSHIRHTYRNFFHPNMRWLFNGIRLARTQIL
ncbi:MAG: ergothioneine biosynthesis protein EgtB [Cyclobacteriaceae bacterium]